MEVIAASEGASAPKACPMRLPSWAVGGGTPRECATGPCQLAGADVCAGANDTGVVCWLHAGVVVLRPRPIPIPGLVDGM